MFRLRLKSFVLVVVMLLVVAAHLNFLLSVRKMRAISNEVILKTKKAFDFGETTTATSIRS